MKYKTLIGLALLSLILLVGCSKQQIKLNISEPSKVIFRMDSNSSLTYVQSITNCSDHANKTNLTIEVYEIYEIIGCTFTELHNKSPEITDEILEKYNIIVYWEGFNVKK